MKALRWLGLGLLLAVLLVLGVAGWLMGSESGLRVLVGQLEARGLLEARSVQGRLLGRLEVEQAQLRVPGLDLDVDHFVLDWRPRALLRGQLHVLELTGAGIRLALQPTEPSEPAGPYTGLALPLDVRVDRLRIEDLALRQGEEVTLLVRHLEAGAALAGSDLRLERLDLDTPWATLEATGHWGLRPSDAGDLTLRWKATVEGLKAPIEGEGSVAGTLQKIEIDQRITQPLAALLQGSVEPLGAGLPWQAGLTADTFAPNALLEGLPELGAWATRVEATGDLAGADLRALELRQDEHRLRGEGRIDWAGGVALETRLGWDNLAWPLAGPAQVESARGELQLSGPLTGYRLEGGARVAVPGKPEAEVALRGTGDLAHLVFDEMTLRALEGVLEAKGEVHWTPAVRWEAGLVARDLRPEVLLPAWPGSLSATARSAGELRDGRPVASVEVERLHGTLRGYPVEASLSGDVDGATLAIDHLDLRSGQSLLEARGMLGEALDLQLRLDSPDLAELLPGASGALKGSAQVAGTLQLPRVQGAFEGRQVGWQDWRVEALNLEAGGGLAPEAPLALRLDAGKVERAGAVVLESARVGVNGSPAAHDFDLVLSQGPKGAELRLAGTGRWDGTHERILVAEGEANRTPMGDWDTVAPTELVAGAGRAGLPRWCWGQDAARVCLEGAWEASQGSSARVDLAGFDLARLDPWLEAQRLRLSGLLAGEAMLDAPPGGPLTLAARLAGERTVVRVPGRKRGEWLDMPLEEARVEAGLGGGLSRLDAVLRMNAANRLEARVDLPGHRLEDGLPGGQPLAGVVEVHYREPLMLAALFPALREPSGVLAGRIDVGGTLGAPLLRGGAQLSDGSVVLPDLGIRVEEADMVINAGPGQFVTLQGGARMGEGRMAIEGRVDLSGLPEWRAEFDLKGENLTALRLPEASVQASPDLKVALRPGETRVTGRVEVPEALFDLGGEKPAAARVSPDVRIVGEEQEVSAQALDAQVELVLGEKVRVRGKGFNGRIAGRLRVIDRPGLPSPVGQGELTIPEGRYKAYGQDLEIEQGRIIYADTALDDPALDIRAVRRGILDGTVAGVRITGRASRPQLAMFSEPAMEQAEVLSYLVTGRSLSKGSGSDAALMVQAARAAGFAGGDMLAGQIGSTFGLEEATIESDVGTEELSLVLGRYLTPRLYLRYVQGLEEGLQTFALRYELTRHFNVQVQSGVKAGVDVFYSFER